MDYTKYNDYELFYMISDNSTYEDSCFLLFDKYERLVKKIARNYYRVGKIYGYDSQDILQAGMIGLSVAINKYDVSKNVLFYTFALLMIESEIKQMIRRGSAQKRLANCNAFSLDTKIFDDVSFIDNVFIDNDYYNELDYFDNYSDFLDFKHSLSFDDACVLELKVNGFSYREISRLLDLSFKDIDNLLNRIRQKMELILKIVY